MAPRGGGDRARPWLGSDGSGQCGSGAGATSSLPPHPQGDRDPRPRPTARRSSQHPGGSGAGPPCRRALGRLGRPCCPGLPWKCQLAQPEHHRRSSPGMKGFPPPSVCRAHKSDPSSAAPTRALPSGARSTDHRCCCSIPPFCQPTERCRGWFYDPFVLLAPQCKHKVNKSTNRGGRRGHSCCWEPSWALFQTKTPSAAFLLYKPNQLGFISVEENGLEMSVFFM